MSKDYIEPSFLSRPTGRLFFWSEMTSRQDEIETLYKQARDIFLHLMTEDEQVFIRELGVDNHATLSEERLNRLREMVRRLA